MKTETEIPTALQEYLQLRGEFPSFALTEAEETALSELQAEHDEWTSTTNEIHPTMRKRTREKLSAAIEEASTPSEMVARREALALFDATAAKSWRAAARKQEQIIARAAKSLLPALQRARDTFSDYVAKVRALNLSGIELSSGALLARASIFLEAINSDLQVAQQVAVGRHAVALPRIEDFCRAIRLISVPEAIPSSISGSESLGIVRSTIGAGKVITLPPADATLRSGIARASTPLRSVATF